MSTDKSPCKNCGQLLEPHANFCPNCGQNTKEKLTLGVLFYNTISNYFSFDAKFLRSFGPLMFKPGYLAKKFVEGQRSRYLHPGNMYLFISVIFFFLFSFVVNDWSKEADKANAKIVGKTEFKSQNDSIANHKKDSIESEKVLETLKKNQKWLSISDEEMAKTDSIIRAQQRGNYNTSFDFNKKAVDSLIAIGASDDVIMKEMGMSDDDGYFTRKFYQGTLNIVKGSGAGNMIRRAFDAVPVAMFILLPLFALILKVLYFRHGRYAFHLVFSFYFFSFLFMVFAILLAVNRWVFPVPAWVSWPIILSTFFYFYFALLKFYKRHWFTTFLKSSMITFIFLIMIIPTALIVLALFGLMNA